MLNALRNRPLFCFCSLFFIAYIICVCTERDAPLVLLAIAAVLMTFFAVSKIRRSDADDIRRLACISAAALAAAVILSGFFILPAMREAEELAGESLEGSFTVEAADYVSDSYSVYTVRLYSGDRKIKLRLTMSDGSAVKGDVFSGKVTLSHPERDERAFLYSDGIFLIGEAYGAVYTEHKDTFSVTGTLKSINQRLTAVLTDKNGNGQLPAAVLLGNRDGLSPAVRRDFSRLGISHLLALSGLHMSVLVSALDLLTAKLRLKKRSAALSKVVLIILFIGITGFPSSVMRAGGMLLLAILASSLDRRADSLTSLSVSAAAILILSPYSVFDVGLLLSVLAAFACILYSRRATSNPTEVLGKLSRHVTDTVRLTLLINAVTLPVMWYCFGEISLISPLTNVVFIPLVTLLLILSLAALIVTGIFPYLSHITIFPLYFVEDAVVSLSSLTSRLPWITVSIRHRFVGILSALLLAAVVYAFLSEGRKRRIASAVTAALAVITVCSVAASYAYSAQYAQVLFGCRGKNEGLIVKNGNRYVIADVSDGSKSLLSDLVSRSHELGACETDTLILTHLHKKHSWSIPYMLDRYVFRSILLPEPVSEDDGEIFDTLRLQAEERGVRVQVYKRSPSESLTVGGEHFTFFDHSMRNGSEHPIIAFAFSLRGREYLYMGGSGANGDPQALDRIPTAAAVFFGAHPPTTKYPYPELKCKKAFVNVAVPRDKLFPYVRCDSVPVTVGKDDIVQTESFR